LSIRNILIISDRGFIGKSIFEDLKNNKKYNIYGLNSDNCDLLNINKTKQTISKIIVKPFTIVFLSTFGRFPEDNYDVYNKNTTMISNLLNNINTNLIEQFIFFSSTCLYGRPPNKIPIIETQECVPNGYYGLSKFVSESLIKLHLKCPICIIRIPGVYGELDNNKSIISNFINNIINNKTITIYDKGLVLRDYVYINDIVKVIKYIIDSNSNITINIATGKSVSLINLIKLIENNLNKKAKINFLNSGHQQFDMTFNINNLMNFMPDFNPTRMEDGIKKYISNKNIKFSSL
tara:strand:- start:6950 stop:7825 length:876 start_codon:yes stop_codon:yes gene_type:complete